MKGQAALEYLLTYGWAIVVILIILGALAIYLPKAPEVCKSSDASTLPCKAEFVELKIVNATNKSANLTIRIWNYGGEDIKILNTTCGGNHYTTLQSISAGGESDIYFNCSNVSHFINYRAVPGKDYFKDTVSAKYCLLSGCPTYIKTLTIELNIKYS